MSILRRNLSVKPGHPCVQVAHVPKCTRLSLRCSFWGQRSYAELLCEEPGLGDEANIYPYIRATAPNDTEFFEVEVKHQLGRGDCSNDEDETLFCEFGKFYTFCRP